MGSNNIEQTIKEIEEFIDSCKPYPFSSGKILVNKNMIENMISELRINMPGEIEKYKRIINNREIILKEAQKQKEAILKDANEKAENMLRDTHIKTSELISQNEIMQQACIQADEIIQNAQYDAQKIIDAANSQANETIFGAMQYTDDILANMQNILSCSIENFQSKYESLISSMCNTLEVVNANREELKNSNEEEPKYNNDSEYEDYSVKFED